MTSHACLPSTSYPINQPIQHSKMMRFFAQCQVTAKLASGASSSHVVISDPSAGGCLHGWCCVECRVWPVGDGLRVPHMVCLPAAYIHALGRFPRSFDTHTCTHTHAQLSLLFLIHAGLTNLMESFLASSASASETDKTAGVHDEGGGEEEGEEGKAEELLRLLTSDEVRVSHTHGLLLCCVVRPRSTMAHTCTHTLSHTYTHTLLFVGHRAPATSWRTARATGNRPCAATRAWPTPSSRRRSCRP